MYSEDKFSEHEVFQTLSSLNEKLEKEVKKEEKEPLQRLVILCSIIDERLSSVDFYTSPSYLIESINNNLKKAVTEIDQYKRNNSDGHISKAERNVEASLIHSKQLFIGAKNEENEYAEVLKRFRISASQHLRYLENDVSGLNKTFETVNETIQSDLKALQKQISEQKQRVDNVISKFQNQSSSLQQEQLNNFQNNEKDRDKKFQDQLEKLTSTFKQDFDGLIEKSNEALESINTGTDKLVETLKEKKEEALELVGVVANTGMAGGYQKVANQAMWTKRTWQGITIASLLGLISFSIYMYTSNAGESNLSLGAASVRIFVTIAIALLAGYAGKQADTNSKVERRNRQMEIELSSIDMYLAKFDGENQLTIKKQLSEKWFGNLPNEKYEKDTPSQTSVLGHISETLLNLSKNMNGKP